MAKSQNDVKRHIRAELDSDRMLKFYKIKFALEGKQGKITNDEVVAIMVDYYNEKEIEPIK